MKILIKLDRFFAWVLFGGMLLYFVSGYGMTKGIIDPALATKLHLNVLTYIILIAFVFHPIFAIHLALKRWRIWNMGIKFLLFAFFTIFIGFFIYVDRYYQPKNKSSAESGIESNDGLVLSNNNQNSNTSNSNSSSITTTEKTFTLSELSKYNGQNSNPAYVAVDGSVYDLTSVFKNGSHFSHYAGQELTNPFYSYHAKSALAKYPVMGQLVK